MSDLFDFDFSHTQDIKPGMGGRGPEKYFVTSITPGQVASNFHLPTHIWNCAKKNIRQCLHMYLTEKLTEKLVLQFTNQKV